MNTADGTRIQLLEDPAAFTTLRREIVGTRHIAVDTEFVRTNTFYPLLGLIQLADDRACYLVDPLPFQDKEPLCEFLTDTGHTLVLHSCSEDLNLLFTALGVVPASVFDTQIAAAFLGLGFSLSYQALVSDLLGIAIPKDETRSDWIKRPLTETQKVYAATDVLYLLQLRELLEEQMKSKGVFDWFEQECRDLLRVTPQAESPEQWQSLYSSINNAWRLNDRGLNYLQRLCVWREQEARRRNKPRSWIAKDGDLLQIAASLSREEHPSMQAMLGIDGIEKQITKRYASTIVQLLDGASEQTVAVDRELLNNPLTGPARKKLKACQRAVQEIAEDHAMAPELLGRKRFILELVRSYELGGEVQWPQALSGWRRELLEPALVPILAA